MKWKAVAISASDAQFIETRKFSRSEIAMYFGVPGWMIGDVERSTSWGTGMQEQRRHFVQMTLLPLPDRF